MYCHLLKCFPLPQPCLAESTSVRLEMADTFGVLSGTYLVYTLGPLLKTADALTVQVYAWERLKHMVYTLELVSHSYYLSKHSPQIFSHI